MAGELPIRRIGRTRVYRTAPPAGSAIASLYPGADLLDAYAVALPAHAPDDTKRLARAGLVDPPAWFTGLLGLRDAIVLLEGVKTSRRIRAEARRRGEGTVAFFPLLGQSATELVLGEDDRHLDFRASVLSRASPKGTGRELVMTTIVHCHSSLGRLYLLAVAPVHRLVVRSNLARAARRDWREWP